ncbi:MAG: heat-inducible transcriptional repressor HrcA [Formosimonas sp.]
MILDERAQTLLNTLMTHYIAQGQPVGSQTLVHNSGLGLSSATVRHVMADLEQLGLVASPHTSAGRVPTPLGYRYFVDALLTASAFDAVQNVHIEPDSTQRMANHTAQLLSHLSQFAGIISTPQRVQTFKHIEFMALSAQRVLVILIGTDGDVQNRLLEFEHRFSPSDLIEASNYLNAHCAGLSFAQMRAQIGHELQYLQHNVTRLMQAAVAQTDAPDSLIVKGERNLLSASAFDNMDKLRQTFDMFDEKTRLLQLLESTHLAGAIQVFIGGESDVLPFDGVSLITAPYRANNEVIGTLGVIGPSRMDYERVIPLVDVTAKLLSKAMSEKN